MIVPAAFVFTAFAIDGLISFGEWLILSIHLTLFAEQCLTLFTVMLLHPIVHNILLILLTPAFQKKITCIFKCFDVGVVNVHKTGSPDFSEIVKFKKCLSPTTCIQRACV